MAGGYVRFFALAFECQVFISLNSFQLLTRQTTFPLITSVESSFFASFLRRSAIKNVAANPKIVSLGLAQSLKSSEPKLL